MKRSLLLLIATLATLGVTAQNENISVEFASHTAGETYSDDPLEIHMVYWNRGTETIAQGDTVWMGWIIGTQAYSLINLKAGSVTYVPAQEDIPAGDGRDRKVSKNTMPSVDGTFLDQALAGQSGDVCLRVSLGTKEDWASASGPADADWSDNQTCLNWFNTISVEENEYTRVVAFPNPAKEQINFNFGTSEIDGVIVRDIAGKVVSSVNVTSTSLSLDLSTYQTGVYFYELVSNGSVVYTNKFSHI